jgi:hypothetical protein
MAQSKAELRAEIQKDLARLDKERQAFERHKKGTARHLQAKRRIIRLRGLEAAAEKQLADLIAAQAGPGAAVRYALAQEGISEHPAGTNSGPQIDFWAEHMGFPGSHVFWCGVFAGYCVVFPGKAKIPTPIRLCSGSYIIDDAHAGRNGLKAVEFNAIQKGDLLSYWHGEHIGLAVGPPVGGVVHTIEGNTSPSTAGSQYNGGCVARKVRSAADVTVAARPRWK